MSPPAFLSPAPLSPLPSGLHPALSHRTPRPTNRAPPPHPHPPPPPTTCTHTLHSLQSSGILTLRPRHPLYATAFPDAAAEPSLIAVVATSHHAAPTNAAPPAVRAAIRLLRPEAVVVELCRARAGLLQPRAQQRAAALAALRMPGARAAGAAGADFRAARQAADEVGARVVLGDRRIACTLRRAWGALSRRDRLQLGGAMAARVLGVGGGGVEDVADVELRRALQGEGGVQAVVDKYVEVLRGRYPGLADVLVRERDLYLAWSMKRSQAVRGGGVVVGVVGAAHVKGVLRAMEEDDERRLRGEKGLLTFRDLVK